MKGRASFSNHPHGMQVHEMYASGSYPLVDGYAPFCKHVFVPNFVGAQVGRRQAQLAPCRQRAALRAAVPASPPTTPTTSHS
jgi:hypothetical protein